MSSFDQLMQEIYRCKRIMNILQNENEELHRSLSELRDGRGIFLVVESGRYPLLCPAEQQKYDDPMPTLPSPMTTTD